jgi:16S rRNA (uracil1498-N3)-methyltransferase
VRRLVVPEQCIEESGRARIAGSLCHYLCRVLRLGPGSPLELIDGTGHRHEGRIESLSPQEVLVVIERTQPPAEVRLPRLLLIYGLSRRIRTEWVLQKATELGVDWIVPGICQRSVARPRDPERKLARWREILAQATRQCDRAVPPLLSPPLPLNGALEQGRHADVRLLATSSGRDLSEIQEQLRAGRSAVAIAVGPEGGFSPAELALGTELGYQPVRLGPLTLRTETAAVAALCLAAFLSGRLDG